MAKGNQKGQVRIESERDIVTVRRKIRDASKELGFGMTDVTRIVTATSELTRNIYLYAGSGEVEWQGIDSPGGRGIELVFEDRGPGIPDVELALEEGYTTSGGLGLGLPGAKRLMDEMEIETEVGRGTKITVRKWRR